MKKGFIIAVLLAAFTLSVMAGCSNKTEIVTQEQAQQIALEQAGLTDDGTADIHTHIGDHNGIPCYNVHITAGDQEYSFAISAADGQILESGNQTGH